MKTARYLLAAAAAITVTSGFAFAQYAPLPGGECIPTTPRQHFLVQGWIGFSQQGKTAASQA